MLIKVKIAGTAAGSFMLAGGGVNLARNASLGNQLLNAGNKSKTFLKLYDVQNNKSLGANPFHGKNFKQIDRMLRGRDFNVKGKDPKNGIGSYFHPKSNRKYYADHAKRDKAIKGNSKEYPHFDVHRMYKEKNVDNMKIAPKNFKFKAEKRKYPLGDRLYEKLNPKQ